MLPSVQLLESVWCAVVIVFSPVSQRLSETDLMDEILFSIVPEYADYHRDKSQRYEYPADHVDERGVEEVDECHSRDEKCQGCADIRQNRAFISENSAERREYIGRAPFRCGAFRPRYP